MTGTPIAEIAAGINKREFIRNYKSGNYTNGQLTDTYGIKLSQFYSLLSFWSVEKKQPHNAKVKRVTQPKVVTPPPTFADLLAQEVTPIVYRKVLEGLSATIQLMLNGEVRA